MSDKEKESSQSSGDEEEEQEEVAAEPLATTRARRSNAGNRMSEMIEDEDAFYNNLYGGFNEEDDDMDFDSEEEQGNDDDYDVDSDFSIDETDEIAPEHQMVDEEPKKKRGVYRDPKPKGALHAQSTSTDLTTSTPIAPRPKPSSSVTPHSPSKIRGERTFRDSTRKKTEETIMNIKSGSKRRKRRRNLEAWKPLTQEEMLAEAKITEEENIRSLETYQRLESEKLKKIKQIKKTLPPPYVTYFSTSMPVIGGEKDERYTRNFLTFVT